MTDSIPAYEPTGPLTVCPCCGEAAKGPVVCIYACGRCWTLPACKSANSTASYDNIQESRAAFARIGAQLRREGKLPPLKEPERWGVWADAAGGWTQHVRTSEVPCSCDVQHPGSFHEMRGTRAEAEAFATYARRYGRSYTVKPYPDAKQTSTAVAAGRSEAEAAPPLPIQSGMASADSAEGGAAKVDPYAAHRLAGERRRAELMAERPGVVARLTLAEVRLAEIDRELARLDRTGEVE